MQKVLVPIVTFLLGLGVAMWTAQPQPAEQPAAPAQTGFAAVPGAIGSQDLTGPYEVVRGWPKDISTLPGNEKWTYGAGQSVFAESPNRVFMLFRGELPKMDTPRAQLLPEVGPSISFPVAGLWRDATIASLPGIGGTDQDTRKWLTAWEGKDDELGIKGPPVPGARRRREVGELHRHRRRQRQHRRDVDPVGQAAAAAALGVHQPVRSREARLDRRRQHAGDLQVHQRRQDSWCRRSARRNRKAPTPPTSTGRRSWTGCRTGRSSCRTATPARASPSSTRTASS